MNPLIYTTIGVGVAAVAVTWYAIVSAKDGYEDETGYHPLARDSEDGDKPGPELPLKSDPVEENSSVPPFMTAR